MKKTILICSLLSIVMAFSLKVQAPKEKQFFLVMTQSDWSDLFGVIRSSGRLTALQADEYIKAINARLRQMEEPADSTKKKK